MSLSTDVLDISVKQQVQSNINTFSKKLNEIQIAENEFFRKHFVVL